MKKLYNDFSNTLVFVLFFALSLLSVVIDKEEHLKYIICAVVLGLAACYVILGYFYSWRQYNSKIFKVWRYGSFQIFSWKDVEAIVPVKGSKATTIWFINSKNQYFLRMASYGTKDYFEVLKEMVGYIKAEKPEIKIPSEVLAQIQKAKK